MKKVLLACVFSLGALSLAFATETSQPATAPVAKPEPQKEAVKAEPAKAEQKAAVPEENWDAVVVNQTAYKAMKAEAEKLWDTAKYAESAAKYLEMSETPHAERFVQSKAWCLNNAGYAYILAGENEKALDVLEKAVKIPYNEPEWTAKVNRNLAAAKNHIDGKKKAMADEAEKILKEEAKKESSKNESAKPAEDKK